MRHAAFVLIAPLCPISLLPPLPSPIAAAACRNGDVDDIDDDNDDKTDGETDCCSSWYDREEAVSDSKIAKRRSGRLHKWIGDTCLLLGSPKVWLGLVWLGLVCCGLVLVWFGLVWFGVK